MDLDLILSKSTRPVCFLKSDMMTWIVDIGVVERWTSICNELQIRGQENKVAGCVLMPKPSSSQGRLTFADAAFRKVIQKPLLHAYRHNCLAESVHQSHGRVVGHSHKRHKRTVSGARVWAPCHHLWSGDVGGRFRSPQPWSPSPDHEQEG